MAFSDPQALVIDGVTYSLPRIGFGLNNGTFANSDGSLKFSISHAYGKRTRRVVRVDMKKTAPDPLYPDTNRARTMSVYLVVDTEVDGFSPEEVTDAVVGLSTYLTGSSAARTIQFVGGES